MGSVCCECGYMKVTWELLWSIVEKQSFFKSYRVILHNSSATLVALWEHFWHMMMIWGMFWNTLGSLCGYLGALWSLPLGNSGVTWNHFGSNFHKNTGRQWLESEKWGGKTLHGKCDVYGEKVFVFNAFPEGQRPNTITKMSFIWAVSRSNK